MSTDIAKKAAELVHAEYVWETAYKAKDKASQIIAEAIAENTTAERNHLLNLLALIHGDGGHYHVEHGTEKATKDAMEKLTQRMVERDTLQRERDEAVKILDGIKAERGTHDCGCEVCSKVSSVCPASASSYALAIVDLRARLEKAEGEKRQAGGEVIKELLEEAQRLRNILTRKGYRESCDIPACNCGEHSWNHGGHAEERLREIADEVWENGVTALESVKNLKARAEKAELQGRHYLTGLSNAEREVGDLRAENERLRKCLPIPDNQGVSFGNSVWISYDKLTGWDGEDSEARKSFYETSIIARGIVRWANNTKAALKEDKQ